jgi:uncharacterized membrane protein YjjB (DUF3815 family)
MDKSFKGANKITQATLVCFFITFMTTFGEIFIEYFSKNLQKNYLTFFKKSYCFY